MHNTPPSYLLQGIELVRAGRRAEALDYLRHAVRTEAVTADGWLWLAAATPDLDEYRNCVIQALRLDPHHPVALRMRDELQRVSPVYIPTPDEYATRRDDGDPTRVQRPSRLRRGLGALVLLLIVGGCIAGIAALAASGLVQDAARDWLASEDTHTLDFTVGRTPAYRFSVDVPTSWMPANTDNPAWRSTRDDLIAAFPPPAGQDSVWDQLDESFSAAVRNPVYGEILPLVHIVETDPDQLASSSMIAALTLTEIVPFPGTTPAPDICTRMRALERADQLGNLSLPPGGEPVPDGTTLAARGGEDNCIFAVERRYPVPASFTPPTLPGQMPEAVRLVWIAVPVDADRYAVWLMTFAEADAAQYAPAVDGVLTTLEQLD